MQIFSLDLHSNENLPVVGQNVEFVILAGGRDAGLVHGRSLRGAVFVVCMLQRPALRAH